jgi:transposase
MQVELSFSYFYFQGAHCGGWSGWWMRQMKGYKITIPPYTPDYNPIEIFFNTVKAKFCSK